jgi:Protein of unknown function (DUF4242)
MKKYMSLHRAPGLLPENWDDSSSGVYAAKRIRFVQSFVNLQVGFIFSVWEAPNSEALVEQFEEWGMPFEEIHEVQFSQTLAEMEARLKQLGRL